MGKALRGSFREFEEWKSYALILFEHMLRLDDICWLRPFAGESAQVVGCRFISASILGTCVTCT